MSVWDSSYSPSSLLTENSGDAPYPLLVYQTLHQGRLSLKLEDYFCTPLRKCPPAERDAKHKECVREYIAASARLDNVFAVRDLREWTNGDQNFRKLSAEIQQMGYLLVDLEDGDLEVRPSLPMCSKESHVTDYQGLCDAHRSAIETWHTKPGSSCIAVAFMKTMLAYAGASDDDFEARETNRDNDEHTAARRRAARLMRALLDKGFVVTRERCMNWPMYDAVNSIGFMLHDLPLPEPLHVSDLDGEEELFFDAVEDPSDNAHDAHLLEQCRQQMKDISEQRQRLERSEKMIARLQVHAQRIDRLEKRICDRSAFMEKLLDAVHCAESRFGVVIEHDKNEPVERGLVNAMGYLIRELAKERMANNRRPADGRRVNGSAAFFDAYMEARKRHCRAPIVTHASAQTDERDVNLVLEVDALRKNNAQLCNAVENAEKVNAHLNEEIALLREQLEKVKIVKREKAKTRKASNDD